MRVLSARATATNGTVRSCERHGRYVVMGIEAPEIARSIRPGQFVSISQAADGRILRRPFSALGASGDMVEVGFDVVGDGTASLALLSHGQSIGITGPLGTSYDPPPRGNALLVGGGYGSAPLIFLAQRLQGSGVGTHLILGAATEERLFLPGRAKSAADLTTIATDDGSAGLRGRVTDAMEGLSYDAVLACGPMAMLAAVTAATAPGAGIQVAVEEFMACGTGICWTCVVPAHEDGYRRHVRSCVEGPVFDGRKIAWA